MLEYENVNNKVVNGLEIFVISDGSIRYLKIDKYPLS